MQRCMQLSWHKNLPVRTTHPFSPLLSKLKKTRKHYQRIILINTTFLLKRQFYFRSIKSHFMQTENNNLSNQHQFAYINCKIPQQFLRFTYIPHKMWFCTPLFYIFFFSYATKSFTENKNYQTSINLYMEGMVENDIPE